MDLIPARSKSLPVHLMDLGRQIIQDGLQPKLLIDLEKLRHGPQKDNVRCANVSDLESDLRSLDQIKVLELGSDRFRDVSWIFHLAEIDDRRVHLVIVHDDLPPRP